MRKKLCAYCGKTLHRGDKDNEHVFLGGLYPQSKDRSKVQRLTIPACRDCNSSWADDEAHFRNILMLAGEPNAVRRELWETTTLRSFDKVDGIRRMNDLIAKMKPVKVDDKERHKVFPGKDERVLRVVRKIIRGLCSHHSVASPVSDARVSADVLKYVVPQGLLDEMICHHREKDIVEYRYQVLNEDGINSVWLITFFERVTFIGFVSME